MEELIKFTKKLRSKINKYKEIYLRNEEAVREQIVSPFLRQLGWDVENPDEVIPGALITERKRKRVDYVLYVKKPGKTKLAIIEVKALGNVEKGISQAITNAKHMNADYAIVTDGDSWQVYRLEKADKIELVCEWSILKDKLNDIINKAKIVANTKDFGKRLEIQLKCPHCNYRDGFKLLKEWKYNWWTVYYYECPQCNKKFRFYVDPQGKRKSFIIKVKSD